MKASVKASVRASMEVFVEVTIVEAFMEASVEVTFVEAFMEASVEAAPAESFVEAFMEASVEVNSLGSSTKNFRGSFNGSFHGHGSFHELPPKMQIVQVALYTCVSTNRVESGCVGKFARSRSMSQDIVQLNIFAGTSCLFTMECNFFHSVKLLNC